MSKVIKFISLELFNKISHSKFYKRHCKIISFIFQTAFLRSHFKSLIFIPVFEEIIG